MFKIGDKITCINNIPDTSQKVILELYSTYMVIDKIGVNGVIINVKGIRTLFNSNRFKYLSEIRKEKLEKICSKLGM